MAKIDTSVEFNGIRIRDLSSAPTSGYDTDTGTGFTGHGIFYMRGGSVYYKDSGGTEYGPLGNSEVAALADLSDVSSAAQTNHFVLASDGGAYYGRALASGDLPAIALNDLSNVNAGSPSANDVLSWSGSAWVNQAPTGGGGSSFYCKVNGGTKDTGASPTANLEYQVTAFTQVLDVGAMFDSGTDADHIICPAGGDGDYEVGFALNWSNNIYDGAFDVRLKVNSTIVLHHTHEFQNSLNSNYIDNYLTASTLVTLAESDTLGLYVIAYTSASTPAFTWDTGEMWCHSLF